MMTCIVIAMYSLFSIFQSTTKKAKSISAGIFALMIVLCIILYMNLNPSTHIEPQLFQQFNPFFVVLLTPISVALFGALAKKGKEPSTPKKIGMGMLIAACGFLVMHSLRAAWPILRKSTVRATFSYRPTGLFPHTSC